jgi:D-sedoheptulose 7-phosphate isomerase
VSVEIEVGRTAAQAAATSHALQLAGALEGLVADAVVLERWGAELAALLAGGGRLLAAGNGGSAAQAEHLTAELVGRFEHEREPCSAIVLHGDAASLTALVNDYGSDEMYARQVRAHGRPGDVLVLLSTSGASRNVVEAARAAGRAGVRTWGLTGPSPNALAAACDEAVSVEAPRTATVQEAHLVAVHLLCEAVERHLLAASAPAVVVPLRGAR